MRPLEVVFLTNFTDYNYRSVPAIAQMADDFALRLTILHAFDAGCSHASKEQANIELNGFFPEADLYRGSERVLMEGHPVDAIRRLRAKRAVDLVIAPAADPLGLPRIGHRSIRARLMRECGVPVWTIGRRTTVDSLRRKVKNVGCWVDLDDQESHHLALAVQYARALGAQLHILHALPEVADVGVALREHPLHQEGAVNELRRRIGWTPVDVHFHVAGSDGRGARRRLVEESGIDLLFAGDDPVRWPVWFARKPMLLDDCPCPMICVPTGGEAPVWPLRQEWFVEARRVEVPSLT